MTNDQAAAFVVAQTAIFNCRVASMVWHNQHQLLIGGNMLYTEEAFAALEREFDAVIGHNAAIELFRNAS